VDSAGNYRARWEPSQTAPLGRYRFRVTANSYGLRSHGFRLRRAVNLDARLVALDSGRAAVELRYPVAVENRDLAWRPGRASIAAVRLRNGHNARVAIAGRRAVITGRPGTKIRIPARGIRDRYGNRNRDRLAFML